jgi:hypothetical protein
VASRILWNSAAQRVVVLVENFYAGSTWGFWSQLDPSATAPVILRSSYVLGVADARGSIAERLQDHLALLRSFCSVFGASRVASASHLAHASFRATLALVAEVITVAIFLRLSPFSAWHTHFLWCNTRR